MKKRQRKKNIKKANKEYRALRPLNVDSEPGVILFDNSSKTFTLSPGTYVINGDTVRVEDGNVVELKNQPIQTE